jgi:hypothetical protein
VAITSKKKGNVIPGVAIATALMPPLCTAGYGLATAQFAFFFGALYLFTINAVFIALSALLISHILKLPIRGPIAESKKKRINQMISLVLALVLIPSIYFGYMLVQRENFTSNADRFIDNVSIAEGNYLLKHEINFQTRTIQLVYGGATLTEAQKEDILSRAADFSLRDVNINIEQGFSYADIALRNSEVETLKAEINHLNMVIRERDATMSEMKLTQKKGGQLLSELAILYPSVTGVSYAETLDYRSEKNAPDTISLVTVTVTGKNLTGSEKAQVEKWLATRLDSRKVRVYFNK